MLLTRRQMELIEAYEKGSVSEEEKQEVLELDRHSVEFYGEHIISQSKDK